MSRQDEGCSFSEDSFPGALLVFFLYALIVSLLAAHFVLAYKLPGHWDEFFFLSRIHQLEFGPATHSYQSLHLYLLRFFVLLPAEEMTQLILGRFIMGLVLVASVWQLYRIAISFFSKLPSLIVVASYLGFYESIIYGNQFRADPLLLLLLLVTVRIILSKPKSAGSLLFASFILALSLAWSLKIVLFLPSIIALLIYRAGLRRGLYLAGIIQGLAFALFLLFQLAHFRSLATRPLSPGLTAWQIAVEQLLNLELPTRLSLLVQSISQSPFFWSYLLAGIFLIRKELFSKYLAFLLPLLSLIFFKNSYPYYYPLALALPAIFVGSLFSRVLEDCKRCDKLFFRAYFLILLLPIFVLPILRVFELSASNQEEQARIIKLSKQISPSPVAYLDRSGMLSTYHKVNPLISRWNISRYRQNSFPLFKKTLSVYQPKILIANHTALKEVFLAAAVADTWILREDQEALRSYFQHCSGLVYVKRGVRSELCDGAPASHRPLFPDFYNW